MNHVNEALARLITQYQDATHLRANVAALARQSQAEEDALQAFPSALSLDGAVGVQLDGIGRIVDFPRYGFDDETYRALLRLKVAVNMSEGDIETMINIATVVMGGASSELREIFPAKFSLMSIDPDPLLSTAATMLLINKAKCGGVGIEFLGMVLTPAFSFLDDPYGTNGGFGSTWQMNGVTNAGIMASINGHDFSDQTPIPDIYEDFESYPGYPATMLSPTDPNKFTLRNGEFDEAFYVDGIVGSKRLFIQSFTPNSCVSWNRPELIGADDYDYRQKMLGTPQGLGLLIRYSSAGGYFLKIDPGVTTKLYKFTGWIPSTTNLIESGPNISATGWTRTLVRCEGERIRAWIKNPTGIVKIMDARDRTYLSGGIGVHQDFDYIEEYLEKVQVNKF